MKNIIKKLLIIFIIICITKIIISLFIKVPLGFADSLEYLEIAKSFHDNLEISSFGEPSTTYPPLYPILLSPIYILNNTELIISLVIILNCILATLIIFPAYLLAKEFSKENKAYKIAIVVSLAPFSVITSFYPLAENIYFPLFLLTIYFLYILIKQDKHILITGVLLGLCSLIKIIGVVTIISITLLILKRIIKNQKSKKLILSILIGTIISIIWPIRNYLINTNTQNTLNDTITRIINIVNPTESFLIILKWIFINNAYIILAATPLIIFLLIKKKSEFKEILAYLYFPFIIFLSIYIKSAEVLRGRYVEIFLAPIIILALSTKEKISYLYLSIIFLLTLPILFYNHQKFFPINGTSLSEFGASLYILNINSEIIISILIIILFLITIISIKYKKNFLTITIIFLTISTIGITMTIYDSKYRWEPIEPIQLGIWINKNIPSNATFHYDKIDREQLRNYTKDSEIKNTIEKSPWRSSLITTYWIRGPIEIKTIKENNCDYIISTQTYPLEIIKHGKIKIYKCK
ncbi:glycosyltransferase family 39 protein [Candidatus Woesearchaeota archaeon]|nr:glycosyltransferase family 39 protein [Candidatus Woesearchaeota archaeon]